MCRAAQHYSGREAIIYNDQRLTFAEAWARGVKLANGLLAMGLQPGDRVGVLEDNSVQAADFSAAAIANLVRVPLYPRNGRHATSAHARSHQLPRLTGERSACRSPGLQDDLPDLEHVFVRDDGYESWLAQQSDVDPDIAVESGGDYFIIRHTGGTTGPSKGVAYTHKARLAAGRDWFYTFPPVEPGDKCLHLGPISHGSGYQYLPAGRRL